MCDNTIKLPKSDSLLSETDNEELSPELIQKEIEDMAIELEEIEDIMSQELNILKHNIGDEFISYAEISAKIGNGLQQIALAAGNGKVANKIGIAALIATTCIKMVGIYKQTKAHNEYLDKLMYAKQTVANARIEKMIQLLPRLEHSQSRSFRLLKRFSTIKIPEYIIANEAILLNRTNEGLRILALYRSSAFFDKLANYILSEAKAWKEGLQTSGALLPAYSDVYDIMDKKIYTPTGQSLVHQYLDLTNGNLEAVYGSHLLLAADEQLAYYALHNAPYIAIKPEDNPLGRIIAANPSLQYYKTNVEDVVEDISEFNIEEPILLKEAAILSLTGVITIFLLLNTDLWGRIVACLLYLMCMLFTQNIYANRVKGWIFEGYDYLLNIGENQLKTSAGYVEQQHRDYEKKSILKAAMKCLLD